MIIAVLDIIIFRLWFDKKKRLNPIIMGDKSADPYSPLIYHLFQIGQISNKVTYKESDFALIPQYLLLGLPLTTYFWVYPQYPYPYLFLQQTKIPIKILDISYSGYINRNNSITNIIIKEISDKFSKYRMSIMDRNIYFLRF